MNKLLKNKMSGLTKGKKKGFTLIELIIVIAIIAILAAIAIPKFGQVTRNANIRTDASNAKLIHEAAAQILAEKPSLATDIDTLTDDVAARLDGGQMPVPRTEGTAFTIAVAADGDITVSVGNREVYPTLNKDYGTPTP